MWQLMLATLEFPVTWLSVLCCRRAFRHRVCHLVQVQWEKKRGIRSWLPSVVVWVWVGGPKSLDIHLFHGGSGADHRPLFPLNAALATTNKTEIWPDSTKWAVGFKYRAQNRLKLYSICAFYYLTSPGNYSSGEGGLTTRHTLKITPKTENTLLYIITRQNRLVTVVTTHKASTHICTVQILQKLANSFSFQSIWAFRTFGRVHHAGSAVWSCFIV